jgi:hypothetical protein
LEKLYKWLKKGLFFKILLELAIEAFFELYINGYMNYLTLEYGTLGENLGFIFTIFSLGTISLILILSVWIFICKSP